MATAEMATATARTLRTTLVLVWPQSPPPRPTQLAPNVLESCWSEPIQTLRHTRLRGRAGSGRCGHARSCWLRSIPCLVRRPTPIVVDAASSWWCDPSTSADDPVPLLDFTGYRSEP